ncbi:hypothetical protein CYMTET_45860 [Cymbomonas tetramitiformis]|uniref:CobW C-terminal domain-containing protein n=1 Tax=Cymbomonas tetramitiformis TaxID=36881 RepID=A0AAE0BXC9_9CHLO|nr:hypothetical protein CYMTET_45860 [Cymbomonas tetramitiformis]
MHGFVVQPGEAHAGCFAFEALFVVLVRAQAGACMRGVLRSKGFVWLAVPTLHCQRIYWSHAGCHFELKPLHDWWASQTPKQWQERGVRTAEARSRIEAKLLPRIGDRRQEVVFIGVGMDGDGIKAALDASICTDAELDEYFHALRGYSDPIEDSLVNSERFMQMHKTDIGDDEIRQVGDCNDQNLAEEIQVHPHGHADNDSNKKPKRSPFFQ